MAATRGGDPGAATLVPAGPPLQIVRGGKVCPCVIVSPPIGAAPGYTLIALIDPQRFQSILLDDLEEGRPPPLSIGTGISSPDH